MGRWEPDARGRMCEAAMQLYVEHGFEQTTVAEIAARAGVTARTFFRHFTDKREVLFAGSELLLQGMVAALDDAPATATSLDAVTAALDAAAEFLGRNHAHSCQRQAVITANPELLERELIKMARIAAALAEGLRCRGVPDPEATLAAEAGVVVLRVAFVTWVSRPDPTDLAATMHDTRARLTATVCGP
ncbi:TetR/AcrR family transcriptional regulator [Dactylosporangium matsuzakiense]|uniref:TetR family transcriptional regulator n=1 Tax=Dactylosporangium matsuzakiense TaxID=53360 RepID=A0A9W6NQ63_9ACTN|nr:TetR/AcrR family transcriptional regulator [Dactylosporangium matsuzakiense]GLL04767.1 TetR family transcriptional regulator [Dactylosporangium matsuzakiense]